MGIKKEHIEVGDWVKFIDYDGTKMWGEVVRITKSPLIQETPFVVRHRMPLPEFMGLYDFIDIRKNETMRYK